MKKLVTADLSKRYGNLKVGSREAAAEARGSGRGVLAALAPVSTLDSERIGIVEAGSDDIIKHKWFADIDQDKMLKQEMKSPYQINVKDENDVSNFESIPDSVTSCDPGTVV